MEREYVTFDLVNMPYDTGYSMKGPHQNLGQGGSNTQMLIIVDARLSKGTPRLCYVVVVISCGDIRPSATRDVYVLSQWSEIRVAERPSTDSCSLS